MKRLDFVHQAMLLKPWEMPPLAGDVDGLRIEDFNLISLCPYRAYTRQNAAGVKTRGELGVGSQTWNNM